MAVNRLKFVIAGAVLATAMLFLVSSAFNQNAMVYYLTLDEFMAQPASVREGDFRISGEVLPGSIQRDSLGLDVRFVMVDKEVEGPALPVHYAGEIPDTFTEKSEVVVEGELTPDGTFEARTLFAKCPSKYEGVDDGGGYEKADDAPPSI